MENTQENNTDTKKLIRCAEDLKELSDIPHPVGDKWKIEESEVMDFNRILDKILDIAAGCSDVTLTRDEVKDFIHMWWRDEQSKSDYFIDFNFKKLAEGEWRVLYA